MKGKKVLLKSVTTAYGYNLGITLDNRLYGQGLITNPSHKFNSYNLLYKREPYLIQGIFGVKKVSIGFCYSLILLNNKRVYFLGNNEYTFPRNNNIQVVSKSGKFKVIDLGLSNVKDIAAGRDHALILFENGSVSSFGKNSSGCLGNRPNNTFDCMLKNVYLCNDVIKVSAGVDYSMAILKDGSVLSFGSNSCGQLGNGSLKEAYIPIEVSGIYNAKDISCGEYHVGVLLDDGNVKFWGNNVNSQFGFSNPKISTFPIGIDLYEVKQISCGYDHSVVLLNNGDVYELKQTKNNVHKYNTSLNNIIKIGKNIKSISAGYKVTMMIKQDNTAVYVDSNVNNHYFDNPVFEKSN